MRIEEIRSNELPPLSKHNNNIVPYKGLNLIRGKNGAGKTTLLEACALLGHASVLPIRSSEPAQQRVELSLTITSNERNWLLSEIRKAKSLIDEAVEHSTDIPTCFQDIVGGAQFSALVANHIQALSEGVKAFEMANPVAALSSEVSALIGGLEKCGADRIFDVCFSSRSPTQDVLDRISLKQALADESDLRGNWWISFQETSQLHDAIILSLLVGYSRTLDGEFTRRTAKIYGKAEPEVGFVSYFNTDMYDFGIGLDIRESPKDFEDKFRETLGRLGIFREPDDDHWIIGGNADFAKKFIRILGNAEIADVRLCGDEGCEQPILLDNEGNNYRPDHAHGAPLSSGENQIFFLCLLLSALKPQNSILLLDEADLHLAIPSVINLHSLLIEIANEFDCQILLVTHMPVLSLGRVMDFDAKGGLGQKGWSSGGDIALYYFEYGCKALLGQEAARICELEYYSILDRVREYEAQPEARYRIVGSIRDLFPI